MSGEDQNSGNSRLAQTTKPRELEGRAILVTRARSQSVEMTSQLESLGARVIHYPTIETVAPDSWARADSAIEDLSGYDWTVFTSANGVRYFLGRLAAKRPGTELSRAGSVVCAIGPATAAALEAAGIDVHLVAADSRSEGVLASIIECAGGPEKLRGLRFLIPRAQVAKDLLPHELQKLGADVDAVEVYKTIRPETDAQQIVELLTAGALDAVTFLSPSAVSNFAALVGLTDLSKLMSRTLVACIGAVTAEAASGYGLVGPLTPRAATAEALVAAIAERLGPAQRQTDFEER